MFDKVVLQGPLDSRKTYLLYARGVSPNDPQVCDFPRGEGRGRYHPRTSGPRRREGLCPSPCERGTGVAPHRGTTGTSRVSPRQVSRRPVPSWLLDRPSRPGPPVCPRVRTDHVSGRRSRFPCGALVTLRFGLHLHGVGTSRLLCS